MKQIVMALAMLVAGFASIPDAQAYDYYVDKRIVVTKSKNCMFLGMRDLRCESNLRKSALNSAKQKCANKYGTFLGHSEDTFFVGDTYYVTIDSYCRLYYHLG